jgi:hypothetical protein
MTEQNLLAASAAVLCALIALVVVALWGRRCAARERDRWVRMSVTGACVRVDGADYSVMRIAEDDWIDAAAALQTHERRERDFLDHRLLEDIWDQR